MNVIECTLTLGDEMKTMIGRQVARRQRILWTENDRKEFVVTWQTSASISEVCQRLQLQDADVRSKAGYLRRHNVKLKKYRLIKPDFSVLQRLAAQYEEQEAVSPAHRRALHA